MLKPQEFSCNSLRSLYVSLHVLARASRRFAVRASGAMPLFPIGELPTETVSSGDAIGESILRLAAPVVATTATSESAEP